MLIALAGCGDEKRPDPDCVEKPRDASGCYTVYHPVCGCNGKTYSNECEARAHGIVSFQKGNCEDPR